MGHPEQEKAPSRASNATGGKKETGVSGCLTRGNLAMFPPVVKSRRVGWPRWLGSAWFKARKGAAL